MNRELDRCERIALALSYFTYKHTGWSERKHSGLVFWSRFDLLDATDLCQKLSNTRLPFKKKRVGLLNIRMRGQPNIKYGTATELAVCSACCRVSGAERRNRSSWREYSQQMTVKE